MILHKLLTTLGEKTYHQHLFTSEDAKGSWTLKAQVKNEDRHLFSEKNQMKKCKNIEIYCIDFKNSEYP